MLWDVILWLAVATISAAVGAIGRRPGLGLVLGLLFWVLGLWATVFIVIFAPAAKPAAPKPRARRERRPRHDDSRLKTRRFRSMPS